MKKKLLAAPICFCIGLLASLPYFHEKLYIFTFIGLFLLFLVVIWQKNEHNRIFMPFFCYYLGFYIPLYLFLSELYPYERFGFTISQARLVVVCSCIIIPLIHALMESGIMYLSKFLPKSALALCLGYASLWVIGEWALTLGSLAFPWGNIAISLTGALPYLQSISLFGKYFISFITVFACCAFSFAVLDKKRLFAIIGAIVIATNLIIGSFLWIIPARTGESIKVAALQGNVLSNEKWVSTNRETIYDRYISMAEEAAENDADVILLPESAIPVSFVENGFLHQSFSEITKKYNTTIIAGVSYNQRSSYYNSVVSIFPDGSASERYDKRHLVPFGEFIPFAKTLGKIVPFVAEFNEESVEYGQGSNHVIIDANGMKITPLVCFDSIFSQFASDGCGDGAECIAIVTNDSWFNDSVGIYTHLRHAQLRAIENGRYVMRAANTGISGFINDKGEIISSTEPLTKDIIYSEVYAIESNTPYTILGDIGLFISFISIIVLYIYRRKVYGKNSASQNRNL